MASAKLVQIFLSQGTSPGIGVYEVSLTSDKDFVCTCPGYTSRGVCMHTRFVLKKVKQNDGTYPLNISTNCTDEDADKAMESPEAFREFIIKFGKIEVC
jgi:hypothetical protein